MATGKVYLLGAGPGDPELVTLRARRRLEEADVVLYDALVHPDVLSWARPDAEKVFVGKRAGRPSERQSQIDQRMIAAARAGKIVARLKGGDPLLFGRGSEEAEALAADSIPFEIVPGVPSPMAAAAYAGISLTHRARSSSITYLTATESVEKDRSSHDWAKLATGAETLVIFMGMRKLPTLMQLLIEHGRDPETPAAVVASASLPRQRCVVGTVATLGERARAAGLGLPALTIVGDVVALRDTLRWYERLPLFGQRVLVTRPRETSDTLARLLRDQGAEPIEVPAIRIAPPADPAPLARAVREVRAYRWIAFTSQNAVDAFFEELRRQRLDVRALADAKVAAVGSATADALLARGVRADLVPDEHTGEAVAEALLAADAELVGARVLIPRAAAGRDVLPDRLRAGGALVEVVAAYRTEGMAPRDAELVRDRVHGKKVDVITFASPSAVRSIADALGAHADALAAGFVIACIGPITADAARARGWPVHVVPEDYTAAGLVAALCAGAGDRRQGDP